MQAIGSSIGVVRSFIVVLRRRSSHLDIVDYELGALLVCLGKKTEAKKHFDLVISGKQIVPPPYGRTGKYSMEVRDRRSRFNVF